MAQKVSRNTVVLSNTRTKGATRFKKLSLDYCVNGSSLHDVIADRSAPSTDAEIDVYSGVNADLSEAIDEGEREEMARYMLISLVLLPAREARIIRLRGLADFPAKWSLKRIGSELGLTKERVRQLVMVADRKLLEIGTFPAYSMLTGIPV